MSDPADLSKIGNSGAVSTVTSRILLLNVVAQAAIVVTGGLVRLTGSGLGCPTWPECVPGSYTPVAYQEQQWHKYVEFGNRLLTFALVAIAVVTFIAVWRHRPHRRPLLLLAAVPFLGTFGQAVLGGITVITGLNPWLVASHLLLSLALIASAVVLYVRGNENGDGQISAIVAPAIRALAWALVVVSGCVVFVGSIVTGSGPHSGDAGASTRFPFDVRSVAWLHADLVLLLVGLIIGIVVALIATGAPQRVRTSALWVLGIAVAQGTLGYAQYFAGVPWVAVLIHQLGATLVWIAVIRLLMSTRERASD